MEMAALPQGVCYSPGPTSVKNNASILPCHLLVIFSRLTWISVRILCIQSNLILQNWVGKHLKEAGLELLDQICSVSALPLV